MRERHHDPARLLPLVPLRNYPTKVENVMHHARTSQWCRSAIAILVAIAAFPENAFAQSFTGTGGFTAAATAVDNGPVPQTPALVSADGVTGAATMALPFALIPARGGVQPQLGLNYRSTDGVGDAGVGWSFGLPVIERRPLSGVPNACGDPSANCSGHPAAVTSATDRFRFSGQPLVPLCTIGVGGSATLPCPSAEPMPPWATTGWSYFRPEYDPAGTRLFWSPDGRTWRVEFKSGETMELGAPTVGPFASSTATPSFDANPGSPIFRWNVAARWDAQPTAGNGTPNNLVVYEWQQRPIRGSSGATVGYLTDVFDTPIPSQIAAGSTAAFAHHTALSWESPHYNFVTAASAAVEYAVRQDRLSLVEVSSYPFTGMPARTIVRRYHLGYLEQLHHSLLRTFQLEGTCGLTEGDTSACPAVDFMPFTVLQYTTPAGNPSPMVANIVGGLPPATSIQAGSSLLNILDVNGDGLADIVETTITAFQTQHVFITGFGGPDGRSQWITSATPITIPDFGLSDEPTQGSLLGSPTSSSYTLIGDFFGQGSSDTSFIPCGPHSVTCNATGAQVWFSMTAPGSHCYFFDVPPNDDFSPGATSLTWESMTDPASCQGPPKNTDPTVPTFLGDINGDGLLDSVSTGGGGGANISFRGTDNTIHQFGKSISSGPFMGTFLVDMNGDGLDDPASIAGDATSGFVVSYQPSGSPLSSGNFFGSNVVTMPPVVLPLNVSLSPTSCGELFGGPLSASNGPFVHDLNGDGLGDFVECVTINGAGTSTPGFAVFWNVDGSSFNTTAGAVSIVPWATTNAIVRVLFGDMDGSGVDDLVATDGTTIAFYDFQPIRAGILSVVDNGLGVQTSISYVTSATISQPPPNPISVVQSINTVITETTGASGVTRTQTEDFVFSGALYDGWEHRVIGFQDVIVRQTSNAATATNHTLIETHYVWDECGAGGNSSCPMDTSGTRAFPPLPAVVDSYGDAFGPAADNLFAPPEPATTAGVLRESTAVLGWQANPVYQGVDGRSAWVVYQSQVDSYRYDTAGPASAQPFVSGGITIGSGDPSTPSGFSPIPFAAGIGNTLATKHVSRSNVADSNGNLKSVTDSGEVGTDAAISWTADYAIKNGDWAWRMTDETAQPFAASAVDPPLYARALSYMYDAFGNLKAVNHTYASPLAALSRATGVGATAPQPLSASAIGSTLTLAAFCYDAYGNATEVSHPNNVQGSAANRCTDITYDPLFFQLPTIVESFTAGCKVGEGLISMRMYDRGLAEVTSESDPSGAMSAVGYDAFGRLLAAVEPDPTTGALSTSIAVSHVYFDVPDFAVREITTTPTGQLYTYGDGTGQTLLTLRTADVSAGDGGPWLASGWVDLTHVDQSVTTYDPTFYTGSPSAYPWGQKSSGSTQVTFDALHRVISGMARDKTPAFRIVYHPLSQDLWDAGNVDTTSIHSGQFSTTTLDGHGRVKSFKKMGDGDTVVTAFSHLATGEVSRIVRTHTAKTSDVYQRWMAYDSLGRMVMNAEPNASSNFSPSANGATFPMWQYAYDDDGKLVGTSDPRHCGENLFYDGLGRLLAEDYSPCTVAQATYTQELETQYVYDVPDAAPVHTAGPSANYLMGRLSAVYDRGAHTQYAYDGRGRLVSQARQASSPASGPGSTLYADTWNVVNSTYDDADRLMTQTTGADLDSLMVDGASLVKFGYSQRGLLTSLGGSYGPLLTRYTANALGQPTKISFADAGQTNETFAYNDPRARLSNVSIELGKTPSFWSGPATATYTPLPVPPPTTLENLTIGYDSANNATSFADNRPNVGWPGGSEPRSKTVTYDDSYQLKSVTVAAVRDGWISPFALEESAGDETPVPALTSDKQRYLSQTFSYDYLGNMTSFNDDKSALFDRSLAGSVTYGTPQTSQLASAAGSKLQTAYDAAGDLVAMTVARTGTCAAPSGACNQFFGYAWDEVGRLASASRWDLTTTPPSPTHPPTSLASESATYLYSGAQRVVHHNTSPATGETDDYTVEIFPSLRLNHVQPTSSGTDYARTTESEAVYLAGLGRVLYDPTLPSPSGSALHVFLELGDRLGSTNFILDRETSELVEERVDQAFGAQDSDLRSLEARDPTRWNSFREDYRFTGKEDETAFGLAYFGARYYSPNLARWISPDPLTIHGAVGDANPYAYAGNSPLMNVDPFGLQPMDPSAEGPTSSGTNGGLIGGLIGAAVVAAVGIGEAISSAQFKKGWNNFWNPVWSDFGSAANSVGNYFQCLLGCGPGAPPQPGPAATPSQSAAISGGQGLGPSADLQVAVRATVDGLVGQGLGVVRALASTSVFDPSRPTNPALVQSAVKQLAAVQEAAQAPPEVRSTLQYQFWHAAGPIAVTGPIGEVETVVEEAETVLAEAAEGAGPLVYGPSAGGRLAATAEQLGGETLTSLPKPAELGWEAFSKQTLDAAAASGRPVIFDLTNVQDLPGVLSGTGQYANTVTGAELRYIQANWARFKGNVTFIGGATEVPW